MYKKQKLQVLFVKLLGYFNKYKKVIIKASLKKQLFFAFLFSLFSLMLINNNPENPIAKQKNIKTDWNMNTFIPEGFVLIPIQLLNAESLNGLIGKWGWVSLYSSLIEKNKKPIVSSIRIIRSPKNNNQFAVLSPENKSSLILEHTAPLVAVIQGAKIKNKSTRFNTKKIIKKNKILIEN
ncbi:MAG: hypothetical protein HAW60_01980 [Bdellovibrionales bacterium]|nr:hypothetical protein [Bdellovibrionales bacterium]